MSIGPVRIGAALSAGLLVASCSSLGAFIGDNLPTWAGGLPPGTPPRAGTPGYDAYLRSIGSEQSAGDAHVQAAGQPAPSRQPATGPIDDPIH